MPDGTSVHPRLRGELFPDGLINDPLIGSSPLTRGTRQARHWLRYPSRFIPAYAGNSRVRESLLFDSAVHPRLRGELKVKVKKVFILLGSSPLTRGTHIVFDRLQDWDRFIPAYAGNSILELHSSLCYPVHPRLRGELLRTLLGVTVISRFIPAYAGNSSKY